VEYVKKFLAHIAVTAKLLYIAGIAMLKALLSIFIIGALCSCKTIHNLASKDTSTPAKTQPKTRQKGDVKFLENITVTPENTSASVKHTTKAQKSTAVSVSYIEPNKNISPSTIESADALQLKYAIVFDATVEKLSNTAMLRVIDQWWGTKYCLGGNDKECVDCSAFTRTVLKDVYGVDLPRTAHEQYDATQRIEQEELQEGDLVFFYTSGRRISHVGIYVMNNKFVHASASQGVTVSDLNDAYWKDRYRGAGRIIKAADNSGSK
jgi:lipoprotein Spr